MSVLSQLLKLSKTPETKVIDRGDFDPKFLQRASDTGLDRVAGTEIHSEYFNSPELPAQSIFDMEGMPYVITQSDRTGASRLITGIDDVKFADPVIARGGQDFTIDNSAAWASGEGPINDIYRVGQFLKKQTGKDPVLMPWRMSPTGSDFANMTYETMVEYARSAFSKSDKNRLNKLIKQHIPDFKGIDSPDAKAQIGALSGDPRKALQHQMDKEFWKSSGLDYGKVRLAIADPNQMHSRTGNLQNVSMLDLAGGIKDSQHPAYPFEIYGDVVGRLTEEVPAWALDPRRIKGLENDEPLRQVNLPKFTDDDRRSLEMGAMGGVITDKQLKRLEKLIATGLLGGAGSAYADEGAGVLDAIPSEQDALTDGIGFEPQMGFGDYMAGMGIRLLDLLGPDMRGNVGDSTLYGNEYQ